MKALREGAVFVRGVLRADGSHCLNYFAALKPTFKTYKVTT